jgi:hypothetical protein
MIEFTEIQSKLTLRYLPDDGEGLWLSEKLRTDGEATILKTFTVTKEMLIVAPESESETDADGVPIYGEFQFVIGKLVSVSHRPDEDSVVAEWYHSINREVLGIEYDLLLARFLKLDQRSFVAERGISIFRRFNDFKMSELRIGGTHPDDFPEEAFRQMLQDFPTTTELNHYARARISAIARNYLSIAEDFGAKYEKYLNKKRSRKGSQPLSAVAPYESVKFNDLADKIEAMLTDPRSYTEAQWQAEILEIILLLFPRYIKAFTEGPVNDSWAKKSRRVDFLLVDASGYIDVIEIKKPFDQKLVTSNCYRDNHVPMRELGGTIMQVEKYLYHFNRWGALGEKKLNKKYGQELPDGLEVKIVNPTGMIIMGRDNDLTEDQKSDFEVIRRKYRNVVDIITYDDLLRRLKVIRDHFISRTKS